MLKSLLCLAAVALTTTAAWAKDALDPSLSMLTALDRAERILLCGEGDAAAFRNPVLRLVAELTGARDAEGFLCKARIKPWTVAGIIGDVNAERSASINLAYARLLKAVGTLYRFPEYLARARRIEETMFRENGASIVFRDESKLPEPVREYYDLMSESRADLAHLVRPGDVDGSPFWNANAQMFLYPPSFAFKRVDGAARYRFTVLDDAHRKRTFTAVAPTASLSPVWAELPVGFVTVCCRAEDADGKDLGHVGERRFWRSEAFDPMAYRPAKRGYAESLRLAFDYLMSLPEVAYLMREGHPDLAAKSNFVSYPSKMQSAVIDAMLKVAAFAPECRERAMRLARISADYLISTAQPKGSPLAGFTATYVGDGMIATRYRGQQMLVYPADAGLSLLAFHAATKETKYLDAAVSIAEKYLELQGEDGSWFLKHYEKDGKPVSPNRLMQVGPIEFLERMYAVTGENRYRAAADRAFQFFERGPLKDWNWEGQFEDQRPAGRCYENLTEHNACDLALYLLKRFPGDKLRIAQARDILRFSEDQFVVWRPPCRQDATVPWREYYQTYAWKTPAVLEQYNCYAPIDGSSDKLIRMYLALYEAEERPLDLAKARALADALVNVQDANGRIRTYLIPETEDADDPDAGAVRVPHGGDWFNCMAADLVAIDAVRATLERQRADCLFVLGEAERRENGAVRDFARDERLAMTYVRDASALEAAIKAHHAKKPKAKIFVCGIGREAGAAALAAAGRQFRIVQGATVYDTGIDKAVKDCLADYLIPVSFSFGEKADKDALDLAEFLHRLHPGMVYVDRDRTSVRKALDEMRFRAKIAYGDRIWPDRLKTQKRYLHGPLSERMLVYGREGKIYLGENEHAHDWKKSMPYAKLLAHGIWLLDEHGESFDFSQAQLGCDREGIPIHAQSWTRDGLDFTMEACSPFGRRASAHVRLTIANASSAERTFRGAFAVRTAKEKDLVFDAPDGYQMFIPRENIWRKLPCTWRAEKKGLVRDGDRFVTYGGDLETQFDSDAGAIGFAVCLAAGESRHLDLVVGKGETERPDYAAVRVRTRDDWQRELARLKLPKSAVFHEHEAAVRNFTAQMLQCFARPIVGDFVLPRQGGLERYVWPGDQINVCNALALLGYPEYVEMSCDFYFGEYASASGEIGPFANAWANDTGSVLDIFSIYCRRYGGKRYWLKHRDAAVRAFRWMQAKRAETAQATGQYPGLFPSMKSNDAGDTFQNWGFTDCVNLDAVEHFAACAKAMDDPIAPEAEKEAMEYRRAIEFILERCRKECAGRDTLAVSIDPYGKNPNLKPICASVNYAYAAAVGYYGECDLLRMREHLIKLDLADGHGLYERNTAQDDGWNNYLWYTTWAELEWARAWNRVGRKDLVRETLDACLRRTVTDEYCVSERVSERTPWWGPWMPNASGCGRIITMMALFGGDWEE